MSTTESKSGDGVQPTEPSLAEAIERAYEAVKAAANIARARSIPRGDHWRIPVDAHHLGVIVGHLRVAEDALVGLHH